MKLSIITINYNNAPGLEQTIKSILAKNLSDFEYLVIDGASTDGSVVVIEKYADKITYRISEPDNGIYNAMNKGIKEAKGEYILFLNSGDIIDREVDLEKIVSTLTQTDLIYYDVTIKCIENNTTWIKISPDNLDFKYFAEDALPHMATFIRRNCLVEYGGYNENMKIVSDWAFFMDAVCIKGCTYKHISGHFSTFYAGGISSQEAMRQLQQEERDSHIARSYPLYNSTYREWKQKKEELYKLKTSKTVTLLKKLGLLKWLKI